ncbi:MAG: hypothetical protein WC700_01160 [Gemmatimonadaceae bacterium]|jgi:hypothetical protein
MRSVVSAVVLGLLSVSPLLAPAGAIAQDAQRVYVVIADSVPMSVPAAATALAGALTRQGWTVLANHAVGTDAPRCKFDAHVVVAQQPARVAVLLANGTQAAFAVPVRLGVFEDERGVHVTLVNPLSVERTMVAESGLEASGRALVDEISSIAAAATRGRRVNRPFGQSRTRGLIGKTMGVMAGGAFTKQVETISTSPGGTAADVRRVADDIWRRLQQPAGGKWQLRGVYRLDLTEQGMVVLGVSGAAMETKAFGIVGAGGDDTRSNFGCPGMAYAAAFPLEIVIRRDGAQVRVEAINAMFRMKMYFEDAGQMKFARNMMMPGSIADELKGLVIGQAR